MYVYSCYISPNVSLEDYERYIHNLSEDIRGKLPGDVIVAGDFNAKSPLWGDTREDLRGVIVGEMMASLHLAAVNEGITPTFIRGQSRSAIDITMVAESILGKVEGWEVTEDESLSPHRFVITKINSRVKQYTESWKRGPIDSVSLRDNLRGRVTGNMQATPEELSSMLKAAYLETTPRVRTTQGKIPYWWTVEIGRLRAISTKHRRKMLRLAREGRDQEAWRREDKAYKEAKKHLRREVRASKKQCWRKTLEDLENDVFGQGYKIVINNLKMRRPNVALTKREEKDQIKRLFPVAPVTNWTREVAGDLPEFTTEETLEAARGLKNGKAPGLDGVPPEVVKVAAEEIVEYMTMVLNNILRRGIFPKI